MSKEAFKSFARLHPELADNVIKDKITWQKLYEIYNIYGENSTIWNKYFTQSSFGDSKISDIVDTIKKVDLTTVQNNIENMQKAISLLQEIGIGKKGVTETAYQARPMYKYFED